MLTRYCTTLMILAAVVAVPTRSARSQTRFDGTAGFDMQAFGFSGSLHDTTYVYKTDRSMSNHFFDASLSGSIVNEFFANYRARAKFLGTFFQSSTGSAENNFYDTPALNSWYASIALLPEKPYPLRLFTLRQLDKTLEYEDEHRSNITAVQPSLNVVRRYHRQTTINGAVLKASLAPWAVLTSKLSDSESESLRQYDFDEDRDIWIDVLRIKDDIPHATEKIEIVNDLPDADIRIIVSRFDTTLAVGEVIQLPIDSGLQQIHIVPLTRYNQFSAAIHVSDPMIWKVEYREPPSPRDQVTEETNRRVQLDLGNVGSHMLSTYFDNTDRFDPTTGLNSQRTLVNSAAEYFFNKTDALQLQTSYSKDKSLLGSEVTQLNKIFTHSTEFSHMPRRGLNGAISHEFTRSISQQGGRDFSSDLQRFRIRSTHPFRKLSYRINLDGEVSLLKDNTGITSDQYRTTLGNRLEAAWKGILFQPGNHTDFTLRDRGNSDGTSTRTKIIETAFDLVARNQRSIFLGDLSLKGDYSYRRETEDLGFDVIKRYGFDILMSKKLSHTFTIGLLTVQKWEAYGGAATQPGQDKVNTEVDRPTDHKATYRVDVKSNPVADLYLNASYSHVSELLSTIRQLSLSMSATIPGLNLPVVATLGNDLRDISDLPRQTVLTTQVEVTRTFRQVTFSLEHNYSKEKLVAQTFSYFEIMGRLTRRFGR